MSRPNDNMSSSLPQERVLPAKAPTGFVRCAGIPNTTQFKSYFAEVAEAVARCVGDPRCVGVSAQRLFYGPVGTPATVKGRAGEEACFMRT